MRPPSGPTRRGSTSKRAAGQRAAAVQRRHHRPAPTSTSGVQPLGRAHLHQPAQLHRPGRRAGAAADRRRSTRSWRRRPLHLQPRTPRRLPRLRGAGRRRGGRLRDHRGGRRLEGRARVARRGPATLAVIEGVYVPSMYDADLRRHADRLVGHPPLPDDSPTVVEKRTIADLAEWPYPRTSSCPLTEVVHDRLNVEVFRGCTRGCRFCQAGMITRPVRERPADQVRTMVPRASSAPATTRWRSPRCPPPT
jgi:hypothetical protein